MPEPRKVASQKAHYDPKDDGQHELYLNRDNGKAYSKALAEYTANRAKPSLEGEQKRQVNNDTISEQLVKKYKIRNPTRHRELIDQLVEIKRRGTFPFYRRKTNVLMIPKGYPSWSPVKIKTNRAATYADKLREALHELFEDNAFRDSLDEFDMNGETIPLYIKLEGVIDILRVAVDAEVKQGNRKTESWKKSFLKLCQRFWRSSQEGESPRPYFDQISETIEGRNSFSRWVLEIANVVGDITPQTTRTQFTKHIRPIDKR